jgi:hypothetical protein
MCRPAGSRGDDLGTVLSQWDGEATVRCRIDRDAGW